MEVIVSAVVLLCEGSIQATSLCPTNHYHGLHKILQYAKVVKKCMLLCNGEQRNQLPLTVSICFRKMPVKAEGLLASIFL